jgi:hypothetical protein
MVEVTRGSKMLTLNWVAFLFSAGAMVFWSFSSCCVSGKSHRHQGKRGQMDKNGTAGNVAHAGMKIPGFGGRGYQQLDDQEKSLIADSETHNRGMEMHDTSYNGGSGGDDSQTAHLAGGSGPYKGRENGRYEPFRSAEV